MTISVFDTHVLNRVVESLDEPSSFLLDTFFRDVQTSTDEFVHFDVDKSKPRITPLVSPLVAGQVVQSLGFETKTFQPAYAKDKRHFKPNRALKRAIGETIGGNLTGEERMRAALTRDLEDQLQMLTRRELVMASEALRLGKITVSGESFPTQVVDFGRDAALTVTLGGTDVWSDTTNATPNDDLESWASTIQDKSGATATTVVMDPKAWQLIRKFQTFKDNFDIRRGSQSTGELGPIVRGQGASKAKLVAQNGSFTIWVYQENYVDDQGVDQKVLPDNTVIVGDEMGVAGVRAYGMIQDEEAGFQASRFFSKSWLEKDPAIRWLLLQSAPVPVPYRVNAVLAATVA